MTLAKVGWTDVDHVGTIMTIGTGDASVIVGTMTDLMNDAAGIAATGELTETMTGDIAIETAAVEFGIAAAARRSHS